MVIFEKFSALNKFFDDNDQNVASACLVLFSVFSVHIHIYLFSGIYVILIISYIFGGQITAKNAKLGGFILHFSDRVLYRCIASIVLISLDYIYWHGNESQILKSLLWPRSTQISSFDVIFANLSHIVGIEQVHLFVKWIQWLFMCTSFLFADFTKFLCTCLTLLLPCI